MKKQIVAILATIAAVFGFGFAANTAMADEYPAPTITVSGNVATATYPANSFKPNETFYITVDDTYISNVEQIALKQYGPFKAAAGGSANLKFTLTEAGLKAAQENKLSVTAKGEEGTSITAPASAPATGSGSNSGASAPTTAETGASIAPYGVAVVLLAAAGVALFAVRKTTRR